MSVKDDIAFKFDKLTRDELTECFISSAHDFNSFRDLAFVESYATKLSKKAEFVVGYYMGNRCCIIAFYANIPPVLFISHVHTIKEFREKGCFKKMLEMIVRNDAFKDFTSIRLEVRKDNFSAITAYVKNGFNIVSETEEKYTMERQK